MVYSNIEEFDSTLWLAQPENSLVLVVDLQPSFLKAIPHENSILHRSEFLLKIANLLGIPCLASEQYPERMGGTDPRLMPYLTQPAYGKMSFSCGGCEPLMEATRKFDRTQIIIVGVETHICVNQTVHHLLEQDRVVFLACDAIGARSEAMHQIGLERLKPLSILAHTESIAYEWLQSAEHPQFREALSVVKEFAEPHDRGLAGIPVASSI